MLHTQLLIWSVIHNNNVSFLGLRFECSHVLLKFGQNLIFPDHSEDYSQISCGKVLQCVDNTETNTAKQTTAGYHYKAVWTRTTRMSAFWEYPPLPHDYPFYGFYEILEIHNNLYTQHTFWSCLTRCANMKWIRLVLWKIQSGHDFVHRQTDRRTDGQKDGWHETSIPPFQLRGIINMTLYAALQKLRQNMSKELHSQKYAIPCPHGHAMGCLLWEILRKFIMLQWHCTLLCIFYDIYRNLLQINANHKF